MHEEFTPEQKHYLEGFAAGSGLQRTLPLAVLPGGNAGIQNGERLGASAAAARSDSTACTEAPSAPDALHRLAQDRYIAEGRKLSTEEQAKRAKNGLDIWDELAQHAQDARFPKGTDVFLFKFHGLFYVAPAQDAFMCRLRFPGGAISAHQLRGVAELSERFADGFADVTTRANLQIRQIPPKNTVDLLIGLHELGIIPRGSGADNIRNITASPTAGVDPHELIDTRPLARQMHHYILHHREMYGLPRKFNIAFDGGGSISALEDTNDIGFVAVCVDDAPDMPDGIYFRMQLGGITGHKDFARDTGILLRPEQCVPTAAAVVRVFLENADRTDRKKARVKYLLDAWGIEKYLAAVETHLPEKLRRFPLEQCQPRKTPIDRLAHIGFHPQKQEGKVYAGIALPVGHLSAAQMRGLAAIAERFGSGDLRLTVWQNLLITDLAAQQTNLVKLEIEKLGLGWSATSFRAGLVACTGSAGCKYAAAATKAHALQLASQLESRLKLDQPINIHLTGCPHSCAQHYIGDIGLLATKVSVGEDMIEGYHLYVGGGYGERREIGRELVRDIPASELAPRIERVLRAWLEHRASEAEAFGDFVKRHSDDALREMIGEQ